MYRFALGFPFGKGIFEILILFTNIFKDDSINRAAPPPLNSQIFSPNSYNVSFERHVVTHGTTIAETHVKIAKMYMIQI